MTETKIKLHNTMTRRKEAFEPLDPADVRMYVCGPTVYDRAHLGNARPVVVFDVLNRLLRHAYGAEHVTYVRNFTDVDDKINARAAETGRKISDITEETTQWFLDDMAALGVLEPDHMPRATQFIPQMVAMIERLIGKGHAYIAEGHVLFRVRSYQNYGRLSGRSVDDMIAGARVEVAPYKEDPMDFVLWKPSTPDLPGWDSPWGRGRPGWHIECSAMSYELLGDSFDIHGGGNDLMFPHHENEIAQSCCAHPEGGFAQVWMHNEMLQVEGKKMSKSLGNFFTVRDVLDGKVVPAVSGSIIRMSFLLSHYRTLMDFGVKRRHEAEVKVRDLSRILGRDGSATLKSLTPSEPLPEVLAALADDLDTRSAIEAILQRSKTLSSDPATLQSELQMIYASQLLLGFDLKDSATAEDKARDKDELRGVVTTAVSTVLDVEPLVARLDEARRLRDFDEADRLREGLKRAGVEVKNTPEGTKWERTSSFDPTILEGLK